MASGHRLRRALIASLALPGTVGGVVPWLMRPSRVRFDPIALPLFALGAALLLWCIREFHVAGRGTLAPWAPPERVVTTGPYRGSRNPMYLAVLLVLAGWAVAYHSAELWVYAAVVAIALELRVITYEEPWLARTYPEQWEQYRRRVRRWMGRIFRP